MSDDPDRGVADAPACASALEAGFDSSLFLLVLTLVSLFCCGSRIEDWPNTALAETSTTHLQAGLLPSILTKPPAWFAFRQLNRNRHIRSDLSVRRIVGPAGDLPTVVDILGVEENAVKAGGYQVVEIFRETVFPKARSAIALHGA